MSNRCRRSAVTLRVLISGGGTGGHIYPCLTIAKCLARERVAVGASGTSPQNVEFLYVGGPRPIDRRLVEEAGLPFAQIEAGGLRGMGVRAVPTAVKLAGVVLQG